MPRKKREKSGLAIYHVMLRGINKQDIFFVEDDFVHMMNIMKCMPYLIDPTTDKIISTDLCHIYAYCILHNHLHLLIREGDQTLSEIMKRIEVSYALYYNKKYERVGHLFQGRFESEPINDSSYFHTVFRYIARNPIKAMESPTAETYPYSSWNEYVGDKSNIVKVIKPSSIKAVITKYPLQELTDWINVDNNDQCLDMDSYCNIKSDKEAWDIVSDLSSIHNPEDFRLLDPQTQIYYLLDAIEHGITIRQASRLGTITYYQLQNTISKRRLIHQKSTEEVGVKSIKGSDTLIGEELEKKDIDIEDESQEDEVLAELQKCVRRIQGLGKQTYHKLHRIIEYIYSVESAKCSDIAKFLGISNEGTRKLLILLVNVQLIEIEGQGRSRVYKIKRF